MTAAVVFLIIYPITLRLLKRLSNNIKTVEAIEQSMKYDSGELL